MPAPFLLGVGGKMSDPLKHRDVGPELDRTEWVGEETHEIGGKPAAEVIIVSDPPDGAKRVLAMYYDPETGGIYVQVED